MIYFSILTSCETSLPWLPEGCSCSFTEAVFGPRFGLSGMSLKEEQLSAIKAVMKGGHSVLWEEPLLPNYAICYGTRTWWR